MPKIPEAPGTSVTPLQGQRGAPQINTNAMTAVNKANAEMANTISSLGMQLADRGRNLQIQEETSQARADYEREVNEQTLELKRQYNETGDFKTYKEDYELMIADIEANYEDRFSWNESKRFFKEFKRNFDSKNFAQADVYQTSNLTKSLVRSRDNIYQNELRSLEAMPMPADAATKIARNNASFSEINKEGGFFTADELEQKITANHNQGFDALMRGYESNEQINEALDFLANKGDKYYKSITDKVDAKTIATWETRLRQKLKVKGDISRAQINRDIRNLKLSSGEIQDPTAIDGLIGQINASDYPDKKELIDQLEGIKVADVRLKESEELDAEEMSQALFDIENDPDAFFKKNAPEFNTANRMTDRPYYVKKFRDRLVNMVNNTADHFNERNPALKEVSDSLLNIDVGEAGLAWADKAQGYIKAVNDEADAKKINNPNLMPAELKKSITNIFKSQEYEMAAAKIETVIKGFEGHETQLFNQLSMPDGTSKKPAISDGQLLALLTSDFEGREDMLLLQGNRKTIEDDFKTKISDNDDKGIKRSDILNHQEVINLVNDSAKNDPSMRVSRIWKGIFNNIELKAMSLMANNGMELDDAVKFAKQKVFDQNFEELDGILIPRFTNVTSDDLEDFIDGARPVLDQIAQPGSLENIRRDKLKWVNSAQGVQLIVDNGMGNNPTAVLNKAGFPLEVTFEDIETGKAMEELQKFNQIRKKRELAEQQKNIKTSRQGGARGL